MARAPDKWVRCTIFFLNAFLFLTFFFITISCPEVHATTTISGIVLDERDVPIEDAYVSVWLLDKPITSCKTGSDGRFEIDVEEASYKMYILADDNSTLGIDYLPALTEVDPSNEDDFTFNLIPAASLVIEGYIQFLESESLPSSVAYRVLDESGEPLSVGGFPLTYGYSSDSQSTYLGIEPSHLVVPAGVNLTVMVDSSIIVKSERVSRSFIAGKPGFFMVDEGKLVAVDVRMFSIPFNLEYLEKYRNNVDSRINDMESLGFYLNAERKLALSGVKRLTEARYLYEKGCYLESFDAAKRSFIEFNKILTRLELLYINAAFSVSTLIFFINFVSITMAFLLLEGGSARILGSVTISTVMLVILYIFYPGCIIIPLGQFVRVAVLALFISLTIAIFLPSLMKGKGGGNRHIPIRNICVPIFSIAKRSIHRRRQRFALTTTSIIVLVMSFVALTSFSEGYGLVVNRVSDKGARLKGVLLRAPGYNREGPIFINPTDVDFGWLERQPESRVISPKAENLPITQPIAKLNGVPIFGIVGVDSAVESAIIDSAVINEGELPSEGGIMISEALCEKLGVEVGGDLLLSFLSDISIRIKLCGVFEDDMFRQLRELDGSKYMPGKLLDVTPEGSPTFIFTLCEPQEIVVIDLVMALRMPLVGITRIDVTVADEVDVDTFAERLALERGYLAWSASENGVILARVGTYFEGKGLSLLVPWGIVVLNVVVTMLNSMYERRKEIYILSSVGLNPTQILTIFFAEASIIGLTAGGVGYLAGISFYKVMAFLRLGIDVQQKVSAFWSLASIGIAMTSVFIGAIFALINSVVITPSLMRHWKIAKKRDIAESFEVEIPVKLQSEEIDSFVEFLVQTLKAREGDPVMRTSTIQVSFDSEKGLKKIHFLYKATRSLDSSDFYTENSILIGTRPTEKMGVKLISNGNQKSAYATGVLVRTITMEWSTLRGKPQAESTINKF